MNHSYSILVTGATGYVGGRLVSDLLEKGHRIRCLVRDKNRIPDKWWTSKVEFVEGDVLDYESLIAAFEGIDVAYYLIHSMSGSDSDLVELERKAATNFGSQAKRQGVDRIIYLGGIEPKSEKWSSHLKSRIETGNALRNSGVSVTEFRAGVIVGSGSLSFELIRYLTERVPILITPKWVQTRTQPISIRDVLSYLVLALDRPLSRDRIIEIGGRDVLTYAEMFARYAVIRNLKRPIIKVPVLTPRLSSLWVGLVTPINVKIARLLIDGLDNEVVVTDSSAHEIFDIVPMSYEVAVEKALERFDSDSVETFWSGSISSASGTNKIYFKQAAEEGLITESHIITIKTDAASVFSIISNLGGETGWLYANFLWRIRGFIDLLLGGIGMRKSRRSQTRLQVGDTLDFWRVEQKNTPNYLLLRAEMKLPGTAWLEYSISDVGEEQCRIVQTAYYEPKGLMGIAYWHLFSIPHRFIFPGMLKKIGELSKAKYESSTRVGKATL